jgi:simple sugar transport system substrate-binding protein
MAKEGVKHALCVNPEVGNVALDLRCKGLADGLGAKVEVLAVTLDPTETRSAVASRFMAGGDIDGVLTLATAAAEPAMEALDTAGVLGKVHFGTFDLSPGVLEAIRDGNMDFAIDQQAFLEGYLPVVFLTENAKYGILPTGTVRTGPAFVTKENAAKVFELTKEGIR